MFDLKVLNSALAQLEEEKGIPREKIIAAIEDALAAAYKKDYGKRGQIIRAHFDVNTGTVQFERIKIVVDESMLKTDDESDLDDDEKKVRFNEEHHILIDDARKIKKDAQVGDEIIFPLEQKEGYGRIAAQTAKQVIIQRLREAEKVSVLEEFGEKKGEIVSGIVQRVERGNVFVDLNRTTAIMPRAEQIPGEYYRQGERIRALVTEVEETPRGIDITLSRTHPNFLARLFEIESPEIANGTVTIKSIAREPGSRSKIAVISHDDSIDPIGSLVGQRGIRVNTVINELGGEKIDIIEWSEDIEHFITQALSPAKVLAVHINEQEQSAVVEVDSDQFSLAIGRAGQNVRLAAKLTGWKIDIQSPTGEKLSQNPNDEATNSTQETTEEAQLHAETTLKENTDTSTKKTQHEKSENKKEDTDEGVDAEIQKL